MTICEDKKDNHASKSELALRQFISLMQSTTRQGTKHFGALNATKKFALGVKQFFDTIYAEMRQFFGLKTVSDFSQSCRVCPQN